MTKYNLQELFRLMVGLLYVPVKIEFKMSRYAMGNFDCIGPLALPSRVNECGTTACLAGHGPLFCQTERTHMMTWEEYVNRAFTGPVCGYERDELYNFLFETFWPDDKEQAAARIYQVLTDCVPDEDDYCDDYSETTDYPVPTREQVNELGKSLNVDPEEIINRPLLAS